MMTFAAIHVGSYELTMKIFEMSRNIGMRQLDFVRYRLNLGRESFGVGKISYETMNVLCDKLNEFQQIMKEYGVEEFRTCATSAIRDLKNKRLVLEQIRNKTGMKVEILSNSEQRFLEYMSIASQQADFDRLIRKPTAIADVGGGSLQISLFDKERLLSTQNIRLGTIWISEKIREFDYRSTEYAEVMEELIQNDLDCYKTLYLKGQEIKHLIVEGELVAKIVSQMDKDGVGYATKEQYATFYRNNVVKNPETVVAQLGTSRVYASMLLPTLILLKNLMDVTGAESIRAPGSHLSDGVAYQYAVSKKFIRDPHDFEEDIMSEAEELAKRFHCNDVHTKVIQDYSYIIFDACRRIHGLSGRQRLLLGIAARLHDCGKFISMSDSSASAYQVVMATEIIGISHREREIIANVIYYNTNEMDNKAELLRDFGETDYLTICKLTAMLRIANVLDRSHRQKTRKPKAVLKDRELVVTVDCTPGEFALEKGMFENKTSFFEEVFGVKPTLRFGRKH